MTRVRRPSPQTIAVLDALAAKASDWSHGYDLCCALGLKAGTVYPILIRLAERGYVETAWEQDVPQGRPPRHLYRLSAAGAEQVREVRQAGAQYTSRRSRVAGRPAPGSGAIAGAQA
ncbi:MAG: PadR family transcriptional regulator [Candidatus Limnocylindrales bacterium]